MAALVGGRGDAVGFGEGIDEKEVIIKATALGGFLQGAAGDQKLSGVFHADAEVILLDRAAELLFEQQIDVVVAQAKLFFVILRAEGNAGVILDVMQQRYCGKSAVVLTVGGFWQCGLMMDSSACSWVFRNCSFA